LLKYVLAPIHKDGWRFIAIFAVVTAILWWLWPPLGWLGLLATAWCIYFFRDPWRVSPQRDGLVLSPADGRIIIADEAVPPPELGLGAAPMQRIAIFMSIFDVHVNRAPMAGRVTRMTYTEGKFVNASLDKASEHNERLAIRIVPEDGPDIAFVLIAGLVARRIVCAAYEGQRLAAGERIGLIRFGSRVDVYCPPPYVPLVVPGQRMVAGETALADRLTTEAPRRGFAH
jgi:phosphatidylserine decarboxylase